MSTRRRYPARHLGLMEVQGSLFYLSKEQRVEFGHACYQVLLRNERCPPRFTALQGRSERTNLPGELLLDTIFLQLFVDKAALWKLKLTSVSTIVVVPGGGGIIVVLGQCQLSSRRLAVVLALDSERVADEFTNHFIAVKAVATNSGYVDPGPAPSRPPKTRPPAPTAASPLQAAPIPDIPSPDYDLFSPQLTRALPEPPVQGDEQRPPNTAISRSASYITSARYDRPLPTPPTQTQQQAHTTAALSRSQSTSSLANMSERPLPTPPTLPEMHRRHTSSDLARMHTMLSERKLPEPPTQHQTESIHNTEHHYMNPNPATPAHPHPKYANSQFITNTTEPSDTSHFYDSIGDWSDNDDEEHHSYENIEEKYYTMLGIDVNDAEQMYITLPDSDEAQVCKIKEDCSKVDDFDDDIDDTVTEFEYKELESDTTLEEDIYFFIKDEYTFKSIIWRIREAIPYLNRDLQSLLKGTETLAGIQNDMYLELSQGEMSCNQIAQIFLSRRDQLERYKYYLLNSPKINRLVLEQHHEVKRQFPRLHKDIQSSWKRLPFYYTSLRKMEAEAPESETKLLKAVVELLRELNKQGDSGILLSGIKGAPVDLFEFAPLLLHSSFNVKSMSLPDGKARYRVLLFPQLIVVTEPKDDGYRYHFHLHLSQLRIKPQVGERKRIFVLQQMQGQEPVFEVGFRATTVEKCQVWIDKIKGLIQGYSNSSAPVGSTQRLVREQKSIQRRQDRP